MALRSLFCVLFALHLIPQPAIAQNCYVPNGDLADKDAPCPKLRGACCPLEWTCLSNGLCLQPGDDVWYERRSCTDQSWQSSGCPQYCTDNNTAIGNENIKQCSDDSWCCNFNGHDIDCCTMDDKEEITPGDGTAVATITSVGAVTSVSSSASQSAASSSASSTSSDSSSDSPTSSESTSSPSTTTTTQEPTTITTDATSSDSTGGIVHITTVITTSAPNPTNATDPAAAAPSSGTKGNNGMTIGLAAGIPIFLIAAAGLAFLLWRRKKQKTYKDPPTSNRLMPDGNPNMVDMYAHSKQASEIDSYPVAVANSPPDTKRVSELSGSNHFIGTGQHSPAVSSVTTMGGNGTGSGTSSELPSYSPSIDRGVPGAGFGGGPLLPVVQEAQELPAEDHHPSHGRNSYIPYQQRYYASAWEQQQPTTMDGGEESLLQDRPQGPRPQVQKRDDELGLD